MDILGGESSYTKVFERRGITFDVPIETATLSWLASSRALADPTSPPPTPFVPEADRPFLEARPRPGLVSSVPPAYPVSAAAASAAASATADVAATAAAPAATIAAAAVAAEAVESASVESTSPCAAPRALATAATATAQPPPRTPATAASTVASAAGSSTAPPQQPSPVEQPSPPSRSSRGSGAPTPELRPLPSRPSIRIEVQKFEEGESEGAEDYVLVDALPSPPGGALARWGVPSPALRSIPVNAHPAMQPEQVQIWAKRGECGVDGVRGVVHE